MARDLLDQTEVGIAPLLLQAGFHTEVDDHGDAVVIRLRGDLDMATAPSLSRTLGTVLDGGLSALTLDLTDLAFVDSTGIRVLITAARRARNEGCSLILRAPSRSVGKVLHLTGLDQLFVIEAPPLPS